jgi:hypothetical protein
LSDPGFRSGTIADAVVRLRSGTSDPDGSDLVTIASTQTVGRGTMAARSPETTALVRSVTGITQSIGDALEKTSIVA